MRRLALALVASFAAMPAAAHNLILEAYVIGDSIEGEAFFSDGLLVADTTIAVVGPDGAALGETVTDEGGAFVFIPTEAVDHLFRLDAGSGHVAEALVAAADLPGGLAVADAAPSETTVAPAPAEAPAADEATAAAIEAAVARELAPLMGQLDAYRERADFLNILGAIGLLCGVAGLAFFAAGARMVRGLPKATPAGHATGQEARA
ncbi:cobalt ABC transporter permease [Pseudoroseicyclus sp. H15]